MTPITVRLRAAKSPNMRKTIDIQKVITTKKGIGNANLFGVARDPAKPGGISEDLNRLIFNGFLGVVTWCELLDRVHHVFP